MRLDEILLTGLGIDPGLREELVEAIIALVWERLEQAESLKPRSQAG